MAATRNESLLLADTRGFVSAGIRSAGAWQGDRQKRQFGRHACWSSPRTEALSDSKAEMHVRYHGSSRTHRTSTGPEGSGLNTGLSDLPRPLGLPPGGTSKEGNL
jgi:hypothetical protein